MKIVFVSNHYPDILNTNNYHEKALEELGHQVIFFEDRNFLIPGRIRQRVNFLQQWEIKRISKKLIKLLNNERPDLCLLIGGYWTPPEALCEIKKMGITRVLRTKDVPIPRYFTNVIKSAPFYDYIFCAGTEAVEIFQDQGLKNVFLLPFACEPDYHRPVELTAQERKCYARDVAFVGSLYPNRVSILESISDLDIGVWGPYWGRLDRDSTLKAKAIDAQLNYDVWVKIYSAAKIVLVIHYNDGQTPSNQASPKLFEALACKSFVLVDKQKDVRTLFEDKKHLVFFEDEKDLREKIGYYLEHADERERIACCGYQEVLQRHTYRHKMEEMLAIVKTRNKNTS